MRRYVIYGLIVLLIVVVLLDFQTAGDNQTNTSAQVATVVQVITATPGPILNTPLPTLTSSHTPMPATPTAISSSTVIPDRSTPAPVDPPQTLNGLPIDSIIVMPEIVQEHVRQIYATGQGMGNNPQTFSKLGDSTIEQPFFLTRFDSDDYKLGDYAYLQATIDHFNGSFARQSVAIRRGLHTWSVLDAMWAPKPTCQPGEHMLSCEFRINKPSVLFIRLGSNDAGIPDSTEKNFREIVEYSLMHGVIPVLGTKADRAEGPSDINNSIIRKIATEYALPLWDFDAIAATLPGRGLAGDNVHMTTFYAHDYTQPDAFQRGHSVHNLTALIALDRIWRVVSGAGI